METHDQNPERKQKMESSSSWISCTPEPLIWGKNKRKICEDEQCKGMECRISYVQKSSFTAQQRINTEKKSFICTTCERSFTRKSSLIAHQIRHTEKKLFPCTECGKVFTKKSNLTVHEKSHIGEKPFTCTECGKSFTQKKGLTKHQIIHTGKRGTLLDGSGHSPSNLASCLTQ
uniref:C2H2-type domain-containing protein n=1 Tax=Salvator merianae TaxID=96440 RepID=A0A8D0E577_SALMN